MNPIISFIRQYVSIDANTESKISELSLKEDVAKGHICLEEGKICRRLYFIYQGTVRTYFYRDGKDITYWIYPQGAMVTSWHSYLSRSPSKEFIEVVEASTLYSLAYEEWQQLFETDPALERFGRLLMEETVATIDDFYKGYYFMTAKEKYELLINEYPDITQRANLGHIASMLGITQETLSRIRGK